jgi:hypothetical protein
MKQRWTMKELKESTDTQILRGLVGERLSELNPYAPLAQRLSKIYADLDKKIQNDQTYGNKKAK